MANLRNKIESLRKDKEILLMSHVVMGHPSFTDNHKLADEYVRVGVDFIELQFPFSEPIADGPVLMRANHSALKSKVDIESCFSESESIVKDHPESNFLVMCYYNLVFRYGCSDFVRRSKEIGILGLIIPDLPPEESKELLKCCDEEGVSLILLVTPKTSMDRIKYICGLSQGMVYCVARTGVSGSDTIFNDAFDRYIEGVRTSTNMPIGVGFGVKSRRDVDHLIGKADIAIVCSKSIELADEKGAKEAASYLESLRSLPLATC